MRKHRDCFAYVLRNKPSPPSSREFVLVVPDPTCEFLEHE